MDQISSVNTHSPAEDGIEVCKPLEPSQFATDQNLNGAYRSKQKLASVLTDDGAIDRANHIDQELEEG